MATEISCILADWGTTNLRGWAIGPSGEVVDERSGGSGLLAVIDLRFAEAFAKFCSGWLDERRRIPAILSGMVGSKLGWKEAPYLPAPAMLSCLAHNLFFVGDIPGASVWIVPGIRLDDPAQPEVMRGEEAQIMGALRTLGREAGVFLLPGTHAKWAIVEGGRLTRFRTYMTGELYGLLKASGTISQLVEGEASHPEAFRRGVERSRSRDAASLLHSLFSVRTLGLLGGLQRRELASYLSGLLIGTEITDGAAWLEAAGKSCSVIAIGSREMIEAYETASGLCGLELAGLQSAAVLPAALLSIARSAGLIPTAAGTRAAEGR
jgi:2-dehydro-3-deoxygalactonokinase